MRKIGNSTTLGPLDVEHIQFRNWLTQRKDLGPGQRPVGDAAAQAIARFHQFKDLPDRDRPRMPCSWPRLEQRWNAFQAAKTRIKASREDARKPKGVVRTPFKPDYKQLDTEIEGRQLPDDMEKLLGIASSVLSALNNIEKSIDTNTDALQRTLEAVARFERSMVKVWSDEDDIKQTQNK